MSQYARLASMRMTRETDALDVELGSGERERGGKRANTTISTRLSLRRMRLSEIEREWVSSRSLP